MAAEKHPARTARKISSAAPVRTSDAWCPGSSRCATPCTLAASACSTCGSVPLVLAPPMNSVGVLIASASALGERRTLVAHLADQRRGVVAQQLFRRRRQALPGAGAFQRIHEDLQAAVDVALGDHLGGSRDPCGTAARGRACRRDRAWRRVRRRVRPGSACAADQAGAARRESRYARRGNAPSDRPARYPASR